jgi:hypothetical protein
LMRATLRASCSLCSCWDMNSCALFDRPSSGMYACSILHHRTAYQCKGNNMQTTVVPKEQ